MSDFNLTKWYRDFYLAEAKDQDSLKKLRNAIRGLVQEEMEDFELEDRKIRYDINPEADEIDLEDLEAAADYYDNLDDNIDTFGPDMFTESEEETEEESEEDVDIEVDEDEDEEAALGTIAADMEGSEGEIMDHLMSALKLAKQMGNDKLNTQIGNTLKFFVS
jgi:hypothetical protein